MSRAGFTTVAALKLQLKNAPDDALVVLLDQPDHDWGPEPDYNVIPAHLRFDEAFVSGGDSTRLFRCVLESSERFYQKNNKVTILVVSSTKDYTYKDEHERRRQRGY